MHEHDPNDNTLYLSHSRLEVSRTCMKQFNYAFIEKIEAKDDDTSAADFGSLIHEIGEFYNGEGKAWLIGMFHKLVPSKYKLSDAYKQKVPLALKNLHTYYMNRIHGNDAKREIAIRYQLADDIKLTGKIDVLLHQDVRKIVVDYKTKKSNKFYDPTDQFAMYMLLLNKQMGIPLKDIDCEIVYLCLDGEDKRGNLILNKGIDNILKTYKVGEKEVLLLEREIKTLYNKVNKSKASGIWIASPDAFACKYCKFNKICDESICHE